MQDLRHQISIVATPQQVYAALTTPTGLAGWWTADAHAEQKIGGKAEYGFDRRGLSHDHQHTHADPGQLVNSRFEPSMPMRQDR